MQVKTNVKPPAESDIDIADIAGFRRTLRALERELGMALESQTVCCGVTLAQCHALLEIADSGTITAGELAMGLSLDKSTMSRTMSGLEARGWVERSEDPANRRRAFVSLSAEGRKRVAEIDELCNATYGRLLAAMDGDSRRSMLEGSAVLARSLTALRESQFRCCGSGRKADED
jgi:DNA-binding MarR family transcriptional regulator